MRIAVATIVLVLLALGLPAQADPDLPKGCSSTITGPKGFRLLCSATWQLDGFCTGEDLWDKWKVAGRPPASDSFIRPFEKGPTIVVGYELVKLQSTPPPGGGDTAMAKYQEAQRLNREISWFMVGSAIPTQSDAMLWLGPGETRVQRMWPADMGQVWPGKLKDNPAPLTNMIDVHGLCFGGGPVTMILTVYFSPSPIAVTREPSRGRQRASH
jgi:hypothetical protein